MGRLIAKARKEALETLRWRLGTGEDAEKLVAEELEKWVEFCEHAVSVGI